MLEKAFRPSGSRAPGWNLLKTYLQTIVFWGFFLFVIPQILLYLEGVFAIPGFQQRPLPGWVLFCLGGGFGLWSGAAMSLLGLGTPFPSDCANQLVVKGPYKYVRNPMAVAGILQGVAVGIVMGSWAVILFSLLGAPVWHVIARPPEERDLENRFGQEYRDYKQKVKCWIPGNFR